MLAIAFLRKQQTMYVPPMFGTSQDEAWNVVREAGAGMLVVQTPSGLQSVFVPVVVSSDGKTLTSHLAKANPWWKDLRDGDEVLGLFTAASSYVSPNYYPSAVENPGVVPTWNYVAAEVRGTLTLHPDAEWMLAQVRQVTDQFEEGFSPSWTIDNAPTSYIEKQLAAIVGIEITVTEITGKAKLSQNRPEIDHDSVREHFSQGSLSEQNTAAHMRLQK